MKAIIDGQLWVDQKTIDDISINIKNIATYSQPSTDEEDQAVLVFHFELSLHLVLRLATHIHLSLEAYEITFP